MTVRPIADGSIVHADRTERDFGLWRLQPCPAKASIRWRHRQLVAGLQLNPARRRSVVLNVLLW
ncbi:hypothetical protein P4S72_01725 [Vibrio sp. PP-XX7]